MPPPIMSIVDIRQSGAMRMDQEELERHLQEEGVGVLALPADESPYPPDVLWL